MKKIYVVTHGSYSDYKIIALFSTKKLANDFIKAVPDEEYNRVEVYELNPAAVNLINKGYSVWQIIMLEDGTAKEVIKTKNDWYNVSSIGHDLRISPYPPLSDGEKKCLESFVWAKTEKEAIKIVNEHRIQLIANGQWNNGEKD